MSRRGSRSLAIALLVTASVAVIVMTRSAPYTITARFITASQVVKGADVVVAGRRVGTVESITLAPGFRAALKLRIDDDAVTPLRRGTEAVIRQQSLSGVANRYVDLRLPDGTHRKKIPTGGLITEEQTSPVVDVDQLFNTLGPRERRGLRRIIQGSAEAVEGETEDANAGFEYLDPSLAAGARLFGELTRDRPALERFVVDSSKLATTVAARQDALAGLVDQLADFTGDLARRRAELGETLDRLPPFLRRANTTFVNLRGALDDLEPALVEGRPAARRLGPVLAQLRPFAREARPTLRDLAAALRSPGRSDDLIDLARTAVPLRDQLVATKLRDGGRRKGTLPELAPALKGQITGFADARPYAPDLVGWFDDFGHSGLTDANGNASRTSLIANAFASVDGVLKPVPLDLRAPLFEQLASLGQNNRCPGAAEHQAADGSNVGKPSPTFECDPSQQLPGH